MGYKYTIYGMYGNRITYQYDTNNLIKAMYHFITLEIDYKIVYWKKFEVRT